MSLFSKIFDWFIDRRSSARLGHVPDITAEQAAEIKELYRHGEMTQKELGVRFGVHQSQISRILSGDRH